MPEQSHVHVHCITSRATCVCPGLSARRVPCAGYTLAGVKLRVVAFALVAAVVLGAPAGTAGWLVYTRGAADEASAQRRALYENRFLEERAKTAAMQFFASIGNERDAGELLNAIIPWQAQKGVQCDEPSALALTDEEKTAFATPIAELVGKDVPKLKYVAWLTVIHRFDHWNIDRDERVAGRRPLDLAELPDYSALTIYAKARLLEGIANDDIVIASGEVQQLARLLMSSELLISAMVATTMLSMERALYDDMIAKGKAPPAAWQPVLFDDINMIRRVARAGFEYGADDDDGRVLDGNAPLDCIAIHEGLVGWLRMRPLVEDSYVDVFRRLDAVAAEAPRCRFRSVNAAWTEDDPSFDESIACNQYLGPVPCLRYQLTKIPLIHHLAVQAYLTSDDDSTGFTGLRAYEPGAAR